MYTTGYGMDMDRPLQLICIGYGHGQTLHEPHLRTLCLVHNMVWNGHGQTITTNIHWVWTRTDIT